MRTRWRWRRRKRGRTPRARRRQTASSPSRLSQILRLPVAPLSWANRYLQPIGRSLGLAPTVEREGRAPMMGWFQALLPKENRFFDLFEAHGRTLCEGAQSLNKL